MASRCRSRTGSTPPTTRRSSPLRLIPFRLARRAGPHPRRGGGLPVPDGRPRSAADVGLRTRHPARRRRPPDVPGGVERRVAGDPRRPRAGPRAGAAALGRGGGGGLRRRAPAGHRGGRPGQSPGRAGAAHWSWWRSARPTASPTSTMSSAGRSWRRSRRAYKRTAGFDPEILNRRPSFSVRKASACPWPRYGDPPGSARPNSAVLMRRSPSAGRTCSREQLLPPSGDQPGPLVRARVNACVLCPAGSAEHLLIR